MNRETVESFPKGSRIKHINEPDSLNEQWIVRCSNNYGASIITGPYSYGGQQGLYELAVITFTGEGMRDFELTYTTDITDDVIGHIEEEELSYYVRKISEL